MRRVFGSALALITMISLSVAQTTPQPANPLRPGSTRSAPAAPPATQAPAATAPTAQSERPKRQRSAAQLANDNRMRACGAEWRANKERLSAQEKTWRVYNVECRARLKAQGR